MSQTTQRSEMTLKPVLYRLPGTDVVTVRRDVPYRTGAAGPLTLDLYQPPDAQPGTRYPAVVFVSGYSDAGLQAFLGCKLKDWQSYIDWGRLAAASGLAGITHSTMEPAADLPALLEFLRKHAASLGIDENRIGLWACSGNGPMALLMLMQDPALRCAALCYSYTLDLEAATHIAETAKTYGFVRAAGKSVADLPKESPLLLVRAGQDQLPHLNASMDRFMAQALAANLPVTLINHPAAPHAFDLLQDRDATRRVIRQILDFLGAIWRSSGSDQGWRRGQSSIFTRVTSAAPPLPSGPKMSASPSPKPAAHCGKARVRLG